MVESLFSFRDDLIARCSERDNLQKLRAENIAPILKSGDQFVRSIVETKFVGRAARVETGDYRVGSGEGAVE